MSPMCANAVAAAAAAAAAAGRIEGAECPIVYLGAARVDKSAIAEVVRLIVDHELPEIARDRNAICYRAVLAEDDGVSRPTIVKAARPGPQRTNPDATFAGEADVLARLPSTGIADAPRLMAHVEAAGAHFLFTSELAGGHPHPREHPLDAVQLGAILSALYAMDRQGFMHYDLKLANVLIDGARAAFIDFEFARFGVPWNAHAPTDRAYCEDFNVASNPFVRARSNVANFEFRAMHRYLIDVEATTPGAAEPLFRAWLNGKGTYHARMAECLSGHAAAHEHLLAALFADPSSAVVGAERALMAFRNAIFERRPVEAVRSRRAVLEAVAQAGSRRHALPLPYADGAARVIELVGRSVHPTS